MRSKWVFQVCVKFSQDSDHKAWLSVSTEYMTSAFVLGLLGVERPQSSCLWETCDLCLGY